MKQVARVAAALALAGCAATAEPVELPGGIPVTVAGATLTLTEVIDQRCPSNLDCVWEGLKRLVIEVAAPDGAVSEAILCNQCGDGGPEAQVAGLTLRLVDLAPDVADIEGLGRNPTLQDYAGLVEIIR